MAKKKSIKRSVRKAAKPNGGRTSPPRTPKGTQRASGKKPTGNPPKRSRSQRKA